MTTEKEANTFQLEPSSIIPIAELTPLLAVPSTRSLRAVVTLTWPFSSATGAVAFLLAEPDFRLRRTRGQVRVQFSGSSAKAVAKSGIASGDEVILCLDGVEFIQGEASTPIPGRGVEFELKFMEKLRLQFQQEGSQTTKTIDIDPSTSDPAIVTPPRKPSPQADVPVSPPIAAQNTALPHIQLATDEYSSPAFIKRARISYGSLFESLLETEDGTIKGRGRKKTRLSSSWRYSSRSPTPEFSGESSQLGTPERATKPNMTDEGVQTIGFREDAAEALTELAKPSTDVGRVPYTYTNGAVSFEDASRLGAGEDTFQTSFAQDRDTIPRKQPPLQSQPVPSEEILALSDLVSPNLNNLEEESLYRGDFAVGNASQEEPPTGTSSHNSLEEDRDDIYNASPVGGLGKSSYTNLLESQDPIVGDNVRRVDNNEAEYSHENQYGRTHSPGIETKEGETHFRSGEVMQNDYDHGQDHESSHPDDFGHLLPHQKPHESSQYPDLDDIVHDDQLAPNWGQESGPFTYPASMDHVDNLHALDRSLSQPHSEAMSRSTSPHLAGADPAESSNERNFRQRGTRYEADRSAALPRGYSTADGQSRTRSEEFEERDDIEEQHEADIVRHSHPKQETVEHPDGSEVGDYSSEEDVDQDGNLYPLLPEQYSDMEETYDSEEDEVDGNGDTSLQNYHRISKDEAEVGTYYEDDEGEGSYDEDDEDEVSYDEEEQQDEGRVNGQQTRQIPEVIEISSSDEEEEEASTQDQAAQITPQAASKGHGASSEDESASDSRSDDGAKDERFMNRADTNSDEIPDSGLVASHEDPHSVDIRSSEPARNKTRNEPEERNHRLLTLPKGTSVDLIPDIPMEDETSIDESGKQSVVREQLQVDDSAISSIPQPERKESVRESSEMESKSPKKNNFGLLAEPNASESLGQTSVIGRISDLDGANNELESEITIEIKQMTTATIEGSNMPVDRDSRKELQNRPSLFARMFNLDGANDEPDNESGSEIAKLPSPDIEPPTSNLYKSQQPTEGTENQTPRIVNTQLLTPETTQLSGAFLSREHTGVSNLTPEVTALSNDIRHIQSPPPPDTESVGILIHESSETSRKATESHTLKDSTPNNASQTTDPEARSSDAVGHQVIPVVASNSQDQIHDDADKNTQVFTADNPRRSHRRVRSTTFPDEIKEKSPPVMPMEPQETPNNDKKDQPSTKTTAREQLSQNSHDASIELALSSLDSPSKHHDLRRPPVTDLKLKLNRNLRTDLEEFTALKVLRYHLNQKLDVLAIATTAPPEPQRAKSGPRHYVITFNVTDPSIAPSGVSEVQIFRPYKEALPIFKPGDGILLRSFQVVSVKNRGFALRSDAECSSWAVFGESDEAEVKGPPVEYGDGEKNHITQMKLWFNHLDTTSQAKLSRANTDKAATA